MPYNGETPTVDGIYTVVQFLQTGEFVTPAGVTEAERVLIVGAAGSGNIGKTGTYLASGGGGGRVRELTAVALSGTMTVTVGVGGAALGTGNLDKDGNAGGSSVFAGYTSEGGAGGRYSDGKGGSCGGAAYAGGSPSSISAGGGAGAGGAGGNAAQPQAGIGGIGVDSDIIEDGTNVRYGGGGGASGSHNNNWYRGTGTDGGGNGYQGETAAQAGAANRGSGGGGGGVDILWYPSGAGSSGIVVVRYLTPTVTLDPVDLATDWAVEPVYVTRDLTTDWATLGLLTRDLDTDWTVLDLTTVDLATDWTVQVCLAVRDRATDWAVRELLERDLTIDWEIVDEILITKDLTTDWAVLTRITRDLATDWSVARKTVIVPDPVGDILAEFNAIDLNNGTTTHVGRAGASLGAMPVEYEAVRGAFGEWQQNEVKQGWATTAITVDVRFPTTGALTAWIKELKDACRAGGTLTWQWDATDVLRTYRIGASSEPEIIEDNDYIIHHRTKFVLALVRWPS